MIICDSRKFVFVHVQKTGGSAVTKLLKSQLLDDEVRTVGRRHAPLGKILGAEPGLRDYWIFGYVRDPWDRMFSWWSMIENWHAWSQRKGLDIDDKWNQFFREAGSYTSFEQFVLEGTERFPRLRRTQLSYLQGRGRRADFIGRTENLAEDVASAMRHVGLSAAELDHHNQGKVDPTKYRKYYSPASRDRVADVFAKDIEEFGYRF